VQVVYGGFQLQRGCANLRVVRATRRSPQTNLPLVESETWIIEGFVRGSTTAELTVNMTSYESAFRVSGGDLKFVDANGSPTAHQLLSSSTVSGTRVDRFEWRRNGGNSPPATEYVHRRSFIAIVSGDRLASSGGGIVSWEESIRIIGTGGPVVIWKPALFGPVQPQITQQQSSVIAIQQGSAVGLTDYPSIPSPLFDQTLLKARQTVPYDHASPRLLGGSPLMFRTSWRYIYEAGAISPANPTLP
jgi:hypothetical protein